MQSVCEQCGKTFNHNKKYARFCSRKCQKDSCRVNTTCPACGKNFWYRKSWPRIYCCRSCSASVNAKKNLGVIEVPHAMCEQCGAEITKNNRTGRRFCSQECFGEWYSAHICGENHPSYAKVECTCEHCGKTFVTKPSEVTKGWGKFCSKECHYHHGSVERTCQQCNKIFRSPKNQVENGGGKFCSKTCVHKWQKDHPPTRPMPVMRGLDHPNFKGGYGPIYYGPNWYEQRRKARNRDKHTCQHCGITEKELGQRLDVHHIVSFRTFGYIVGENNNYLLANDIKNLTSLCRSCHMKVEANESSPLQMPLLLSIP